MKFYQFLFELLVFCWKRCRASRAAVAAVVAQKNACLDVVL